MDETIAASGALGPPSPTRVRKSHTAKRRYAHRVNEVQVYASPTRPLPSAHRTIRAVRELIPERTLQRTTAHGAFSVLPATEKAPYRRPTDLRRPLRIWQHRRPT